MKRALFIYGGWEGHTPKEGVDLFAPILETEHGFEVELSDSLDVLDAAAHLNSFDVIVPVWTMGEITPDQERNLIETIRAGVGLAGWHGGMCDAFRNASDYHFMTGGQFVAHPGNIQDQYRINIVDHDHTITYGIGDFTMHNTEQYYMHVDPTNHVLATTTFHNWNDAVIPAVWARTWSEGRVAYASFGHTHEDFQVAEARTIVTRCMLWAAKVNPSEFH